MSIKTAGELRGFLAEIMLGIRAGEVEPQQANAIAKIAAQINQSLSVEVNTHLQLERMGKDRPIAGSMLIGSPESAGPLAIAADQDGLIWCDQCDGRVSPDEAAGCKSKYCSLRKAA